MAAAAGRRLGSLLRRCRSRGACLLRLVAQYPAGGAWAEAVALQACWWWGGGVHRATRHSSASGTRCMHPRQASRRKAHHWESRQWRLLVAQTGPAPGQGRKGRMLDGVWQQPAGGGDSLRAVGRRRRRRGCAALVAPPRHRPHAAARAEVDDHAGASGAHSSPHFRDGGRAGGPRTCAPAAQCTQAKNGPFKGELRVVARERGRSNDARLTGSCSLSMEFPAGPGKVNS